MKIVIILALALQLVLLAVPTIVRADSAETPVLQNPIKCDDVRCLATQIIRIFLGLVAITATIMFIYGGYIFLTSGGNAEAVKKGKETLLWSTVGIVVVMISWALVTFAVSTLSGR